MGTTEYCNPNHVCLHCNALEHACLRTAQASLTYGKLISISIHLHGYPSKTPKTKLILHYTGCTLKSLHGTLCTFGESLEQQDCGWSSSLDTHLYGNCLNCSFRENIFAKCTGLKTPSSIHSLKVHGG